jgi:hypothetical protein
VDGPLWAGEARPGRYDEAGLDWRPGPSEWAAEEAESSEGLDEMAAAAEALAGMPRLEQVRP